MIARAEAVVADERLRPWTSRAWASARIGTIAPVLLRT